MDGCGATGGGWRDRVGLEVCVDWSVGTPMDSESAKAPAPPSRSGPSIGISARIAPDSREAPDWATTTQSLIENALRRRAAGRVPVVIRTRGIPEVAGVYRMETTWEFGL